MSVTSDLGTASFAPSSVQICRAFSQGCAWYTSRYPMPLALFTMYPGNEETTLLPTDIEANTQIIEGVEVRPNVGK